jgi:hypothetical protein
MNTHDFRPSKRGTFLTSLQGRIHGVSEIMCIQCWCRVSKKLALLEALQLLDEFMLALDELAFERLDKLLGSGVGDSTISPP